MFHKSPNVIVSMEISIITFKQTWIFSENWCNLNIYLIYRRMVGKTPIENAIGMVQKITVSSHLKLTFFFYVVHENNVSTAANNNETPIEKTLLIISLSSLYLNLLDEKKLLENHNYLLSEIRRSNICRRDWKGK